MFERLQARVGFPAAKRDCARSKNVQHPGEGPHEDSRKETPVIHLPEDREICEALLRSAWDRGDRVKSLPDLITETGSRFLGAPYEPDTLEAKGPEELVVNLRAFDCITFVENAVVLAGLISAGKTDFADYLAALERIRYRRGRCDGYPSRLHYFTDWLYYNGRKGLVRDITREIGGVSFRKAFHSLTDRREDHPGLKDPEAFRRLRLIEGICSRRNHSYIPKADLARRERRIAGGDIIAITTDEKGIDVAHAGLAVRLGEEIRLLHASRAAGRVVLAEVPLKSYLRARRSRTGVIVGRAILPDTAGRHRAKRSEAPRSSGQRGRSSPSGRY
jgi:hypothetical protein